MMYKKNIIVMTIAILATFAAIGCTATGGNQQTSNISMEDIIHNTFKVDFGEYAYLLDFTSETEMTYTRLPVDKYNEKETVRITITELRPDLNMVYWKEDSGATVTHVEDFANKTVYTNITFSDGTFLNMKGALTKVTQ